MVIEKKAALLPGTLALLLLRIKLTPAGGKQLEVGCQTWERFTAAVDLILRKV